MDEKNDGLSSKPSQTEVIVSILVNGARCGSTGKADQRILTHRHGLRFGAAQKQFQDPSPSYVVSTDGGGK